MNLDFIKTTILQEIIAIFFGLIIVGGLKELLIAILFGRWKAIVIKNSKKVVTRKVSSGKRYSMFREPSEKSVYMKGIASPYGHINCDILEECKKKGIFFEDKKKREMIFNFDKQKKNIDSSGDIFYLDIDFQKQSVKLKNEDEKPKYL